MSPEGYKLLARNIAVIFLLLPSALAQQSLELSRAAHTWEFFDAVGQKAAILGKESGTVEGWVYPLKLFKDFRLVFHFGGRSIPAENLARRYTIRPEASTITFQSDSFMVNATYFVPPQQPGGAILLEIDTFEPLEIEAQFVRDFQLMWPASIGATYMNWDKKLRGFTFGEESRTFFGVLGSPTAGSPKQEFFNNNAGNETSSFRLSVVAKGKHRQMIVFAGSVKSGDEAEQTYALLSGQSDRLLAEAKKYYADYLVRTVNVSLPNRDLQLAYDWARISTVQGLVDNPFLGKGLIAGYRTSGNDWRPGFAWFFGRDSLWTDLALTSIGDFETTRTALEFISKYQRADGKIPHEVAQSANFLPWFEKYPWGWAAADATPLYIIALSDYVQASGDQTFGAAKFQNAQKAYNFMRSTYDRNGFPKNDGVGHGWVEGGPLLPIETEFYQAGTAVAALHALVQLRSATQRGDFSRDLENEYQHKLKSLNQVYWSAGTNTFAFATKKDGTLSITPTVLTTVPMWFEVTDAEKASKTINVLTRPDHLARWGMRILSSIENIYDPTGYHYGSVWPLFTGWASVGGYKQHRPDFGWANLESNANLTFAGPLGRVTEVLSGSYEAQLATSSPHQIWSSAMVISPLMRGLFGIESNQIQGKLVFHPHVPEDWREFRISNLPACGGRIDIEYMRSTDQIAVQATREGAGQCTFDFSPAVNLPSGAALTGRVNGRATTVYVQKHADMHTRITTPLQPGRNEIVISFRKSASR